MRLLMVDTETTGTDESKDSLIEVALCGYDVQANAIIEVRSMLVRGWTNAAEHINGIPPFLLQHAGEAADVHDLVELEANGFDFLVAHNADFDRKWFRPALRDSSRWVCSCNDIEWPNAGTGSKSLASLALAHGVPVAHAHRAFDDVLTLARMFQRIAEKGHDVATIVRKAARAKQRYVSLAPFDQRDVVKAHGFRWDPTAKVWWRNMPPDDVNELPFKVRAEA